MIAVLIFANDWKWVLIGFGGRLAFAIFGYYLVHGLPVLVMEFGYSEASQQHPWFPVGWASISYIVSLLIVIAACFLMLKPFWILLNGQNVQHPFVYFIFAMAMVAGAYTSIAPNDKYGGYYALWAFFAYYIFISFGFSLLALKTMPLVALGVFAFFLIIAGIVFFLIQLNLFRRTAFANS